MRNAPLIVSDSVNLYQELIADDVSRRKKLYERLVSLFFFFKYYGVPQLLWAMSRWSETKLGNSRPPLPQLTAAQIVRLKEIMKDLGIYSSVRFPKRDEPPAINIVAGKIGEIILGNTIKATFENISANRGIYDYSS